MSPQSLVDAEARRRIAEDFDTTFVVEAAAGTGKTTALVSRLIGLVRSGRATLSRVVAVTFMEKAAGEMKLRVRAAIEGLLSRDDALPAHERERLLRALEELETAAITTMHSLCADLLRARPIEAGVDPRFAIVSSGAGSALYRAAFGAWFRRVLADPPEGVRRFLRRPRAWGADGTPRERLEGVGWQVVERRDFPADWRRDPWDRAAAIDATLAALREAVAPLEQSGLDASDYLYRSLSDLRRVVDELDARERSAQLVGGGRDLDGLEGELVRLGKVRSLRWQGRGQRFGRLARKDVAATRDAAADRLVAFCDAADADLAAALQHDLAGLVLEYERAKERSGELDFTDLLLRTRELLAAPGAEELRVQLATRYTHLFVDEFQDTDPLQAHIVLLLASSDPRERDPERVRPHPGKLFLVGDPKQSIYRFRRADLDLYNTVTERLLASGAQRLELSTSFRSVPEIQTLVNRAFEPRFTGGHQARHVPLSPARPPVLGADGELSATRVPPLVALPVPAPFGPRGEPVESAVNASYGDAVGAFVDWLVTESQLTIEEEGRAVAVEPRHICLLFRRLSSYTGEVARDYVRALEARGIRHVLLGGASFHDRAEVLAVRNALTAIEWPDDTLAVYATLRGPLFAFEDAALFVYRAERGHLHPLKVPELDVAAAPPAAEPEALAEIDDALRLLRQLHRERNRRPIAETLVRLYDEVRAHAGLAILHGGEQALANALRVAERARDFEADGATSFRAFVERLLEDAARGQSAEAPIVEEDADGVRLMTVHKAKGLEFPIVILCDPLASRAWARGGRWLDREKGLWAERLGGLAPVELLEHAGDAFDRDEEEVDRLTYVAATRARDALVVPICGDSPLQGWLDPLTAAITPAPGDRAHPEAVPYGDWRGADTVLERQGSSSNPVRAGLYRLAAAPSAASPDTPPPGGSASHPPDGSAPPGLPVVVWAPGSLALRAEAAEGLRYEQSLREGPQAAAGVEAWQRFLLDRALLLDAGSVRAQPVATVTQLAEEPGSADRRVTVAKVTLEGRESHGRRFGTLVHAVLATAAFGPDGDATLPAVAALFGRQLGASELEVSDAVLAARAFRAHEWLQEAASGDAQRELPVAFPREGVLVEGVIDLLYQAPGGQLVVVDYKTDTAADEELLATYCRQVALYAQAVEQAQGLAAPVSARLLVLQGR